jgi:hypothetical protein
VEYYAVTAQVLATLLLGLVIGLRNLSLSRGGMTYFLVFQMIVSLGAIGACIWAIRHGHSTDRLDRIIEGALVFTVAGFGTLIARWFLHPDDVHSGRAFVDPRLSHKLFEQGQPAQRPQRPSPRRGRWGLVLFAALIGLLVGSRRS